MRSVTAGIPWGRTRAGASLPMFLNSVALILAKVSTMGFGFLAWMLAARLFAPAEVGIASAAVSAVTLCSQIALLGISSAIIAMYPAHREKPAGLLNTAFSITIGAALVTGSLFLLFASYALEELQVIASTPLYTLLFLVLSILGTLGVAFDQTSTVLRRGDQALARGVLAGLVTVGFIGTLPMVTGADSSLAVFVAWTTGAVAAFVLGCLQLWRSLARYRFRPSLDRPIARQLLAVGLPNYALTVVERAPGPIMPIVVAELLSPVATAHWYAIWMMSWIVFIVPIQVAINLFAEASHRPESLAHVVRQGLRTSLALGVIAAAGVGLMAHFMMSLLGSAYAEAGTTPLRILIVTVIPFTFIQAYFAVCRATRRLREAVVTCAASGVVGVSSAVTAGVLYGLTGMAAAWVTTQILVALWAGWRLRLLLR